MRRLQPSLNLLNQGILNEHKLQENGCKLTPKIRLPSSPARILPSCFEINLQRHDLLKIGNGPSGGGCPVPAVCLHGVRSQCDRGARERQHAPRRRNMKTCQNRSGSPDFFLLRFFSSFSPPRGGGTEPLCIVLVNFWVTHFVWGIEILATCGVVPQNQGFKSKFKSQPPEAATGGPGAL